MENKKTDKEIQEEKIKEAAEELTRIFYDSQVDNFTTVLLLGMILGICSLIIGFMFL